MSFFDNKDNIGMILIIIGALSVLFGIISLFIGDDGITVRKVLQMIGSVIAGVIYAFFGFDVRKGAATFKVMTFFDDFNSKYGLLLSLVAIDGVAGLISGILGLDVFSIIVAILVLVVAYFMVSGGNIALNVIWIILCVVIVLGLIASIIASFVLVGIPFLLLYITMLTLLLSPEVKQKMGM